MASSMAPTATKASTISELLPAGQHGLEPGDIEASHLATGRVPVSGSYTR